MLDRWCKTSPISSAWLRMSSTPKVTISLRDRITGIQSYRRKVNSTRQKLGSSWQNVSTVGLYVILPAISDRYWGWAYKKGCCAPPLGLRHRVAAAGTASLMGLYVGWQDARNTYGKVLTDVGDAEDEMLGIIEEIRRSRWEYSINAKYYGRATRRIE